jgi:hypothetical protein
MNVSSKIPVIVFDLQSRAQVATEFLLELNEDVCGDYIEDVS